MYMQPISPLVTQLEITENKEIIDGIWNIDNITDWNNDERTEPKRKAFINCKGSIERLIVGRGLYINAVIDSDGDILEEGAYIKTSYVISYEFSEDKKNLQVKTINGSIYHMSLVEEKKEDRRLECDE